MLVGTRRQYVKAIAALVIGLAALACSQHAAPKFGLGDVLLVRIVPSSEELERGSLDVAIQITNHTKRTARFGDGRVHPWLEALLMDDPELAQGFTKGHGQALSPFTVEPGGTVPKEDDTSRPDATRQISDPLRRGGHAARNGPAARYSSNREAQESVSVR